MALPQGPARPSVGVLIVLLVALGAALAGCIAGLGGDAGDDLVFSDSRGPGGEEPLIPLTQDVHRDAAAIIDACVEQTDMITCANDHLKAVLGAAGSVYAFDVLAAMTEMDDQIGRNDHPMAHVLGRYALYVYGTLGNTLSNCSYKVFQGCLHGALQEFFEHAGALDQIDLNKVCPAEATNFEIYACMHGLGHGLVLATDYNLAKSLDLCDSLTSDYAMRSCLGGAFMENVVAHNDHLRAGGTYPGYAAYASHYHGDAGHGHDGHGDGAADGGTENGHDHSVPPRFWIEPNDLLFPCNVVKTKFEDSCWRMQTSLILFLSRGDFHQVAQICLDLREGLHEACHNSMGRDASAWSRREPGEVAQRCGLAHSEDGRASCVRGAIVELVTNYADPTKGLPFCDSIVAENQAACYEGLGRSARSHFTGSALRSFCAEIAAPYDDDCRKGAGL